MPFRAESHDFSLYPEYKELFDKSLNEKNGGFVPCVDRKAARSLNLSLRKWRRAWEAQVTDDSKFRYSALRIEIGVRSDQVGVLIRTRADIPSYEFKAL